MVQLNPALLGELAPGQRLEEITRLDVPGRDISEVVDLALCTKLTRLDVSKNSLRSLDGISLPSLRWLSVAGNQVSDVSSLRELASVEVLNLGRNLVQGKLAVGRLKALKALIANENKITLVGGLDKCRELNTLVLSHNNIAHLGGWLSGCPKLEKLSLSHNALSELGPVLKGCPMLKELRLNHNQLCTLPDDLDANTRLRILDLGGNPIARFEDIQVLSKLPQLRSLSLKGCPLSGDPRYRQRVAALVPGLDILDNQRITERPAQQAAASVGEDQGDGKADHGDGTDMRGPLEAPLQEQSLRETKQRRAANAGHQDASSGGSLLAKSEKAGKKATSSKHAQQQSEAPDTAKQLSPPPHDGPRNAAAQVSKVALQADQQPRRERPPPLVAAEAQQLRKRKLSKQAEPAAPHDTKGDKGVKAGQQHAKGVASERQAPAAQPPGGQSDDDEAADAAELLKRPVKNKRDARETGVVKVIDNKRRKGAGGSGTGAQALQMLLQPGLEAGGGLPAWD